MKECVEEKGGRILPVGKISRDAMRVASVHTLAQVGSALSYCTVRKDSGGDQAGNHQVAYSPGFSLA
jgi:hypothetical protein